MQNWHAVSIDGVNRATNKTGKYLGEEQRERQAEHRVQSLEKHGEQGQLCFEVKNYFRPQQTQFFPLMCSTNTIFIKGIKNGTIKSL